jgi:putative transposase
LPRSLRTDNGSPFASNRGLAGLTQFSVWLLKLNFWPDRIAPGRPDQDGRHERMHRTLNQDSATPRSADLASQQLRMDLWRADFNTSARTKPWANAARHRSISRLRGPIPTC